MAAQETLMIKIEELTQIAKEAALKAGTLLLEGFGSSFEISEKEGRHNLVTSYDKASQAAIIGHIFATYPDHAFLAEEGGVYKEEGSDYLWIIDPLDGTVNFAHNIPIFSVSIACLFQGKVVVAVVYHPITHELFVAQKGKGAFLGDKKLQVSATPRLDSSILVTGFPYNVHENPRNCIDIFSKLVLRGIPIRRLGSAALDLCYLAAGRFDGFWEVSLEPWDLAAGKLIVEEAGGKVTQFDGSEHTLQETTSLIATNGHIHNALKREVS